MSQQLISIRWEHSIKKRYYQIALTQDLFGDWVITKVWGGINQATGRIIHMACNTYEEAEIHIRKIQYTRKKRGYELKEV